jgi:uncharacterized protein YkwD
VLWTRRAALLAPLGLATEVEPPPLSRAKLDAVRLDPDEALDWLNGYRARSGLPPVRLDGQLTALAQAQAEAMAAADKLSHDVNGGFAARLAAANLRTGEAGENVCAGYFSTAEAMESWRRSPEHDVNLRLRSATRFGVALAKNPRSRWGAFWAMAIASPPLGAS